MSIKTRNRRFGKTAAAVVGAITLGLVAFSSAPANAQVPYLGIDLGNGIGLGLGTPPSAYGLAPASPLYPLYGAPALTPPYYYYRW